MGGTDRLLQTIRRLRPGRATGALILLYHRVADVTSDPCRLCVSPGHFAEHLEVLRRYYDVLPLRDVLAAVRERGARPAVVITFDDGYADNLLHAKPALERSDAPATVLVTSGHVGTDRELWWDELEQLLLQPGTLPSTLRLCADGSTRQWDLGEAASYTPKMYARHARWSLLEPYDPGPRQQVYRALVSVLYKLPSRERYELLEGLSLQAIAPDRSTHRVMTPEQLRQLAGGGLIEVGAHTLTHPVLSAHPLAIQREEIHGSKQQLEEILGRPVDSFAYPFGTFADYTGETVAAVREAGFSRACSNFPGLVRQGVDPFQLPRFMVFNWGGEKFARKLRQWLRESAGAAPGA